MNGNYWFRCSFAELVCIIFCMDAFHAWFLPNMLPNELAIRAANMLMMRRITPLNGPIAPMEGLAGAEYIIFVKIFS
jgi:hypothetical protein